MDRERYQPWVFYYPSALRLGLLGDYLNLAIARLHARHRPERVFIVAHSMGGLVAWSAVRAHQAKTPEPYVALLVTMASPLGGMGGASAGVDHAPVVMPCWIDLDPRSDFLAQLYNRPLPDSLGYALLHASEEPPPEDALTSPRDYAEVLDGFGDGTVKLTSQLHVPAVARADTRYGFVTTHMGVLRDASSLATLNGLLDKHTAAAARPGEPARPGD
ncbi:MAG: hypothetical protein AAFX76_12670 [Planctomycetota bacterium]